MAVLHTHAFGPADGEPLLALHGVTAHGRRSTRPAEEALPDRRLLAVDLRGHGRSPSTPPWNLEQHGADLVDTLAVHGVARADVLGHSFGGLIATHLAAAAPERVRSLALLDPAIGLDPDDALGAAEEARDARVWDSPEEGRAARADLGDRLDDVTVDAGHVLLWDDFEGTATPVRAHLDAHGRG